jgi:shikimate dehydrogenase
MITGATRVYAILGDPIEQVRSPQVFNALFEQHGVDAVLIPLRVPSDRLETTIAGLKACGNLDGMIVTVPHKQRMADLVDRLLPTGAAIGAINAVRREPDGSWVGDMFDGRGFVMGLRKFGHEPRGLKILQLGAGGAGSAVAHALAEAGAASITLFDVDATRAARLVASVAAAWPATAIRIGAPEAAGHDMLVNATPVGMAPGDGLPLPQQVFDPTLLVAEVIMKPEETPLLRHAKACGCRTQIGRHMLEQQAAAVARFFGIGEEKTR